MPQTIFISKEKLAPALSFLDPDERPYDPVFYGLMDLYMKLLRKEVSLFSLMDMSGKRHKQSYLNAVLFMREMILDMKTMIANYDQEKKQYAEIEGEGCNSPFVVTIQRTCFGPKTRKQQVSALRHQAEQI